jgi:hypothetical protein
MTLCGIRAYGYANVGTNKPIHGEGAAIDVTSDGKPIIVNIQGDIYQYNLALDQPFTSTSAQAWTKL